jgi:glycosyltransferase involved in cell wall biosynthesis
MDLKLPFFSVIIPTHARPRQLSACLEALTRLAYPSNSFEVIVVDDGSDKPLNGVVDPFRNQINVILLCQANAGPATARNRGASQARGRFLAFTDDDCMPAPDWIATLAKRFAATPDCAIGGTDAQQIARKPFFNRQSNTHRLPLRLL